MVWDGLSDYDLKNRVVKPPISMATALLT